MISVEPLKDLPDAPFAQTNTLGYLAYGYTIVAHPMDLLIALGHPVPRRWRNPEAPAVVTLHKLQ
jgi:hypothetical protein